MIGVLFAIMMVTFIVVGEQVNMTRGEIVYKEFKRPVFKKKINDVSDLEEVFAGLRRKLK